MRGPFVEFEYVQQRSCPAFPICLIRCLNLTTNPAFPARLTAFCLHPPPGLLMSPPV